ncbi:MAG: DUF456 domain-containing protein [Syntrophomonadaceae bacterium]|nr:DUF456 domain-containing protein [Syntrophomonadaceae bacterium]
MNTAAFVICLILILIGIAGAVLPFIPGIPLIFIAIAAYGWVEDFATISVRYIIILAALTLLSALVDYLASYWGAKYTGAGKLGQIGAVIGVVAGILIFPPIGIFLCPWLGAWVGELIAGKEPQPAAASAIGALIGLFSGMVFNLVIGVGMLISFLIVVI